ncbi:MAG: hypothetical protein WDM90_00905 [Ferruginibacter sp.]
MKNLIEKIIAGHVDEATEPSDILIRGVWHLNQRVYITTDNNKFYKLLLLDEMVGKYKSCNDKEEIFFKCKKEDFHYMWIVKDILQN